MYNNAQKLLKCLYDTSNETEMSTSSTRKIENISVAVI
jgi:hypothetical protein